MDEHRFIILAGADNELAERTDMVISVRMGGMALTEWQETRGRDWRSIEVCNSPGGWMAHYSSALDGFEIIASKKLGNVDGSFASIYHFAHNWVRTDDTRRYAFVRVSAFDERIRRR